MRFRLKPNRIPEIHQTVVRRDPPLDEVPPPDADRRQQAALAGAATGQRQSLGPAAHERNVQ